MLDAPDEEVSALIGLSPELHHERALRRKGQFRSCTDAVRRLVLHAEPTTPQFPRGPEKTVRLAVKSLFR